MDQSSSKQNLHALQAVVLAVQNLIQRDGVVAQHDPSDPDAAIASLRELAKQYAGKDIPEEAIDRVISTPIATLFPQYQNH